MAMMLCGLRAGDEVILPSFTFSSTATSIITMNIDERKIEAAITDRTRAIVVVHYAGVSCAMDEIMSIADRHGLKVVEDAAQAFMSTYRGRACGTMGDFGCCSFHETKNYSMGEGGALLIRDREYNERAEILREKGTNRSKFYRGEIDKYTWIEFGDSYLPSELNAAYLWAQLERADEVNDDRLRSWRRYRDGLKALTDRIEIPSVPEGCRHNAHMFWIKLRDLEERTAVGDRLRISLCAVALGAGGFEVRTFRRR